MKNDSTNASRGRHAATPRILLVLALALAAYGCARRSAANAPAGKTEAELDAEYEAYRARLEGTVFVWPDWEDFAPHFTVPGSVKTLPHDAFDMGVPCVVYSIEDVELQPGVEAVEPGAFAGAECLERLVVPASCTNLANALSGCESLWQIDLAPDHPAYRIDDGFLLSRDGRELLYALRLDGRGGRIVVPDGVERIDDGAFADWESRLGSASTAPLEEIVLPASLREIGDRAFDDCRSLRTVALPEGLERIGERAFEGCGALEELDLPASLRETGEWAFYNSGLRRVGFADGCRASLGGCAFWNCGRLERVTVPGGVRLSRNAFRDCGGLVEATLGPGTRTIPDNLFSGCKALERVSLPEGVETIGSEAFAWCVALREIDLPASLRTVSADAWRGCDALRDIRSAAGGAADGGVFVRDGMLFDRGGRRLLRAPSDAEGAAAVPDGVEEIGNYAFSGSRISDVRLPDSLREIGFNAFRGCANLAAFVAPPALTNIAADAFRDCVALRRVALSDAVERFRGNSFEGCANLAEFHVGAGVGPDGFGALPGEARELRLSLSPANEQLRLVDGCIVDASGETLLFREPGRPWTGALPDGVRTIRSWAIPRVVGPGARRLVVPDGVEEIGTGNFCDSPDVREVEIPDSVRRLGGFQKLPNLRRARIGRGLLYPDYCFMHSALTNLEIAARCVPVDYLPIPNGSSTSPRVTIGGRPAEQNYGAPDHGLVNFCGPDFHPNVPWQFPSASRRLSAFPSIPTNVLAAAAGYARRPDALSGEDAAARWLEAADAAACEPEDAQRAWFGLLSRHLPPSRTWAQLRDGLRDRSDAPVLLALRAELDALLGGAVSPLRPVDAPAGAPPDAAACPPALRNALAAFDRAATAGDGAAAAEAFARIVSREGCLSPDERAAAANAVEARFPAALALVRSAPRWENGLPKGCRSLDPAARVFLSRRGIGPDATPAARELVRAWAAELASAAYDGRVWRNVAEHNVREAAALLWALAGPDPSDWAARGDLALLLAIHAAAAATGEAWCLHPDSDAFPLAWILASSSGPAPDATAALAPAAPPAALPERFDPILAFPELPAGGFLDNLWAAAAPQ